MNKKIIATVSNNIATDQRLIKVGNTLQKHGYDFLLIGTKHRGTPKLNHIPFKTKRLSIFFNKNVWFYAELQIRLFFQLLKENKKHSILLANDLDTLLPVWLISKLYKIPLVFDSHEIFSELPTLKKGSIQKNVWKFLEKFLVPKVDKMYTVSDSYAQFFKEKYVVNAVVISNFPKLNQIGKEDFKNQNNLSNSKIIIYQGAINFSRGIDKMILAMKYLENAKLWIVGDGPLKNNFEILISENNLQTKVKFWGQVTPGELKEITSLADLGLSLEEDNGLSYRYALPNKLFDYIHAGIPILGSCDLPEVQNIIQNYQVGDIILNHQPKHIAKKIKTLLNQDKSKFDVGLKKAQKELNWECQEDKLLAVFDEASSHK